MFEKNFYSDNAWYAMVVRPGREQIIKQDILKHKLKIDDIVIPEPPQKLTDDNEFNNRYVILLGYIFLKLKLDVETYNALLNIESIYRFLGSIRIVSYVSTVSSAVYFPCRIAERQIVSLKKYLSGESKEDVNKKTLFNNGDEVEITSGDLSTIRGKISQVVGNYAYIIPSKFITQTIKVSIKKIIHSQNA